MLEPPHRIAAVTSRIFARRCPSTGCSYLMTPMSLSNSMSAVSHPLSSDTPSSCVISIGPARRPPFGCTTTRMSQANITCTAAIDKDGGNNPPELFHHGEPYEALKEARKLVENGFEEMIAGWRQ
jgi:hypothetical protein